MKLKKTPFKQFFLFLILLFVFCNVLVAQDSAGLNVPSDRIRTGEEGLAAQEFRRGVQAYYRGSYNEEIMQFEKALVYLPSDNLILDWLGKTYYKAGLEGTALMYWERASSENYGVFF